MNKSESISNLESDDPIQFDVKDENDKFECINCQLKVIEPFTCLKCGCLICKCCFNKQKPNFTCPKCQSAKDKIVFNPALKLVYGLIIDKCSKGCGFRTRRQSMSRHDTYCNGIIEQKCCEVMPQDQTPEEEFKVPQKPKKEPMKFSNSDQNRLKLDSILVENLSNHKSQKFNFNDIINDQNKLSNSKQHQVQNWVLPALDQFQSSEPQKEQKQSIKEEEECPKLDKKSMLKLKKQKAKKRKQEIKQQTEAEAQQNKENCKPQKFNFNFKENRKPQKLLQQQISLKENFTDTNKKLLHEGCFEKLNEFFKVYPASLITFGREKIALNNLWPEFVCHGKQGLITQWQRQINTAQKEQREDDSQLFKFLAEPKRPTQQQLQNSQYESIDGHFDPNQVTRAIQISYIPNYSFVAISVRIGTQIFQNNILSDGRRATEVCDNNGKIISKKSFNPEGKLIEELNF